MKFRNVALSLVVGLVATLYAAVAAAGPQPVYKELLARTSLAAAAGGFNDSTTATIGGDAVTIDTLQAFESKRIDWQGASGALNTTAHVIGHLFIESYGTVASFDSVFTAVDFGATATGPWVSGTLVGTPLAAANDKLITVPVTADADAASNHHMAPWLRFRVRCDGNSAALFTAAKFRFAYIPAR